MVNGIMNFSKYPLLTLKLYLITEIRYQDQIFLFMQFVIEDGHRLIHIRMAMRARRGFVVGQVQVMTQIAGFVLPQFFLVECMFELDIIRIPVAVDQI